MLLDFETLSKRIKKEKVDKSILFTPQDTNYTQLFESITMPHWSMFVTLEDINRLYWIATTASLVSNFEKKRKLMDEVMNARGFKFMAGGTNRMVYRHYEFPGIVAKVPIDRVGMGDNIAEYQNQKYLWPYCAKMIQVTPSGMIGFAEKVEPILNRWQFNAFAPMIYLTTLQIVGKYVLEDIGTQVYKNWGVRTGWGPVLLDYPFVYELDGRKLICHRLLSNGQICRGEIDYDAGFNHLYCTKCGRMYHASELRLAIKNEELEIIDNSNKGGRRPMLAKLMKGDKILSSNLSSDSIVRPDVRRDRKIVYSSGEPKVALTKGGQVLASNFGMKEGRSHLKNLITTDGSVHELHEINLPMIEEEHEEPTPEPISTNMQQTENATIISELYENPEVYKPEPETKGPAIPVPTQEIEDKIAEEISKQFEAPTIKDEDLLIDKPRITEEKKVYISKQYIKEEVNQEIVEVSAPEQPDEFPPNQWTTPPTFNKRPRRVITDSGSGNNDVQMRPNNPYKK